MITTLAFTLATAGAGKLAWCRSLHAVALATAEAQARGLPRRDVEQAALQLPGADARAAAADIIDLAYTYNPRQRIAPAEFADIVERTCLAPEAGQ